MATVTGYTAEHLQKWISSAQSIVEEIEFAGNIDDTEDVIHTITVPEPLVPVYLEVAITLTLDNSVASSAFQVSAYVDDDKVSSVINNHPAGTGLGLDYSLPTSIPVLLLPEETVDVTCRGQRHSGTGVATRNTTAISVMTVRILPQFSLF